MTSRRSFLRGVLTLGATALVAPRSLALPSILGDGQHNDGPGLNALFRGEPVNILSDSVEVLRNGAHLTLTGGNFATAEPILFRSGISLSRVSFGALCDMPRLLGSAGDLENVRIDWCNLDSRGHRVDWFIDCARGGLLFTDENYFNGYR